MSPYTESSFVVRAGTDIKVQVQILNQGVPEPLAGWSDWAMEWRAPSGKLLGAGTVNVTDGANGVLELSTSRDVTALMQPYRTVVFDVRALDPNNDLQRPISGPRCPVIPYVTEMP